MRRVKRTQDARCAAGAARLHQQELEELRSENARLEKQVVTLHEQLQSTKESRDRLLHERMEIDLRAEAQRRCDKVGIDAQFRHRAALFNGMREATEQLIRAERRIADLESEVDSLKNVRVAS